MNYKNIASHILYNGDIESKLAINERAFEMEERVAPARNENISFSSHQIKFPKTAQLIHDKNKALALHFFANHELLAIELFAWAILTFDLKEKELQTLMTTIKEEQKHLKLYLQRMSEFKVLLGDFPLNSFLWNTVSRSDSFEQFYGLMALTFEQANLDFMKYFIEIFTDLGDEKTCQILKIVYQDEISHVARGRNYLNDHQDNSGLWEYYRSLLPNKISPARAKGMRFDEKARERAGLDKTFIMSLKQYKDEFKVTNRKEWKKDSL